MQASARLAPEASAVFRLYDISTPLRQAHFLAQVGHESWGFKFCEEIASGAAYEGRRDLGNTEPGDGMRFKGRGWIQLTGRTNYKAYSDFKGINFVVAPQRVATEFAGDVAGWYWHTRKLNAEADEDDLLTITKRINGGLNGIDDRRRRLAKAKLALEISKAPKNGGIIK